MNRLYDHGRNAFLLGDIDWLNHSIKVVLLTNNYVPNLASDQYLSDIPLIDQIAVSQNLYDKTAVAGVAGAAPTRAVDVVGPEVEALVLFKDTGLDSTSPLIAYIDVANNMPIVPEGADLLIQWNSGLIFKL